MQCLARPNNPLLFEELETRLLLSAGAEGLLAYDAIYEPLQVETNEPSIELLTTYQIQNVSQKTSEQAQEIIFIDNTVENYQQIIEDLKKEDSGKYLEIVILDEQQNGVQQISETLAFYQEIDAIHFVTHGTAGTVQLGDTTLNSETLNIYGDEIASWSQALSSTADLLFYGCDVAQDEQGKLFISQLSELTGADVAASNDLTGEQAKGGDWELEYQKGTIETGSLLDTSVRQYFSGVLALDVAPSTVSLDENSANGTVVTTVTATGGNQFFQEIYWVDYNLNKIVKANIDGTGQSDVLTGLSSPLGFVIDHDAGKMYWSTDQGAGSSAIMRANLDGTSTETIISGLSTIDTLVLDTAASKIYWTDSGSNEIARADMIVGATEEVLFDSLNVNVTNPQGIDFDYTTNLMYVYDSADKSIATFDVTNIPGGLTVLGTSYFLGDISVDPGVALYAADVPGNYIHRFDLDGTNETTIVIANNNGRITIDPANNSFNTLDPGVGSTTIQRYNLTTGALLSTTAVVGPDTPEELDYANPATIAYSITAGNTNNAFTINSSTGSITVNDTLELDYETTTSYSLTITATQNADSTTGIVTVNINDLTENAPTSANNSATVNEDLDYVFVAADFNFSDADVGDTLTSVKITSLETAGSLELNGVAVTTNQIITIADITAGNLAFTPAANANSAGYDSFSFSVNDGILNSGIYTMTINVNSVNDAPTGTNTTVFGIEDTDYIFVAANFGFTDTADPGDALTAVKITTLTSSGALTLNGAAVNAGDTILIADIIAGKLIFTPVTNSNGTNNDSFTFQVQDDGGLANSGADLDASPNTITIDITAENDSPTATNYTIATNQNLPYTFVIADFNYSDIDNDAFNSIEISGLENNGSLELNGVAVNLNDVITVADISAGNLKFVPTTNGTGAGYDSFSFRVSDGLASSNAYTMTIDVNPTNTEPTANNSTILTNEDLIYTFIAADFSYIDSDGDAFSRVKITSLESNGSLELNGISVGLNELISVADINAGNLKFVPEHNANGSSYDSFGFTVNDGITNSIAYTMTIDVTGVNDAPTAANNTIVADENLSYTFVESDFNYNDIDGDTFNSVIITSLENNGSLELNGTIVGLNDTISVTDINAGNLRFVPASNASGSSYDNFSFVVNDGNLNSTTTYNMVIDVTAANTLEASPAPANVFFIIPDEETRATPSDTVSIIDRNIESRVNDTQPKLESVGNENSKNNESTYTRKASVTGTNETKTNFVSSGAENNNPSAGFVNSLSFDLYQTAINGYSSYSSGDASQVEFSKVGYSNFNFYADTGELREFLISLLQSSTNSIESKILDGLNSWNATNDFKVSDSFNTALDLLRMQLLDNSNDADQSLLVGTVKSSGVVLAASVGTWVLRGSTVLASVLSSLPMWNSFDPLPILSDANAATNKESQDNIDDLFERNKKE